ncbi:MAG TPA: DegQ family serine endoprotease [Kiloniellales bacterium]
MKTQHFLADDRGWAGARIGARMAPALLAGALGLWSAGALAATPPDSFAELAKKVTPAVVNISTAQKVAEAEGPSPDFPFKFPKGSPFEEFFKQFRERQGGDGGSGSPARVVHALGSGFIIDPSGYVVTNNHVIDKATEITVTLGDDKQFPAKLVGTDPQTDLALLKIESPKSLPSVSFGDSDKANVGDWVMAVGNPFGLGGTVTAGIVSARGRNIQAGPFDDFLQIDAAVNQGNSGGPTFDMSGKVVGINTAIASPNGGSVGIGFAIPSNLAKPVIEQLRAEGKVTRGWLGVQVQVVSPEIAAAIGLKSPSGAIVANVVPNSPAAKAELRQGDVILQVKGKDVGEMRDLPRIIAAISPGQKAKLGLWRHGAAAEATVEIAAQPGEDHMAAAEPSTESGGVDAQPSHALGVTLARLTDSVRQDYSIPGKVNGVVVTAVDPNGPAVETGLQVGDVIEQVGGTAVDSPAKVDDLVRVAKDAGQASLLLLVNRGGDYLFIGIKVGVA